MYRRRGSPEDVRCDTVTNLDVLTLEAGCPSPDPQPPAQYILSRQTYDPKNPSLVDIVVVVPIKFCDNGSMPHEWAGPHNVANQPS